MRIALIGNLPPPPGGVATHVAGLASALRERGAEVIVLDLGSIRASGPGALPARGPRRYARALATIAPRRALVHVHTSGANWKSWAVAGVAALARVPGAPRPVLTLHSGLLPGYLSGGAARRRLARGTCALFGRVFAVSEGIASALHGAGVARELVAVLPAYLSGSPVVGTLPDGVPAFRASSRPLFCAAIAPGPTYGEDLLVEAFSRVRRDRPRAGLVLFGPGSGRESGRREDGVLRLGPLPHSAALAVVEASDAFLRPTRQDGDAISVREALALARPVVASDSVPRPVECSLFCSGDSMDLARAMLEAAEVRTDPLKCRDPQPGPVDTLLATYQALEERRPIASHSERAGEHPCSRR